MAKPLRVAGEVDSFCTKCRMVLNHRIVSMHQSKPHQVECLTCRSTHRWRPQAPGERPAAGGERARSSSSAAGSASKRAPQAPRHEQIWEKAIAGRGVGEFRAYNLSATFREGELVHHKKFGDGVVTRVIDAGKVEVLFKDEARTLAQGMS